MPPFRPRLLQREVIEGYRRDRVVAAVAGLAHKAGIDSLTTSGIIRAARMSRNTFYELFESKDDCLELACVAAAEWLSEPVKAAAETGGLRAERLDTAVGALLGAAAGDPPLAELCLIHSPAISARGSEAGGEVVIGALAETIANGHEEVERFVAGAIVSVVATRFRRGEAEDLADLHEGLVGFSAQLLEAEPAAASATPSPAALVATA